MERRAHQVRVLAILKTGIIKRVSPITEAFTIYERQMPAAGGSFKNRYRFTEDILRARGLVAMTLL